MSAFLTAVLWNAALATVLAVVVFAVCRIKVVRLRPALQNWLWLAVLVKLVTPPSIGVPILPTNSDREFAIASTVDDAASASSEWTDSTDDTRAEETKTESHQPGIGAESVFVPGVADPGADSSFPSATRIDDSQNPTTTRVANTISVDSAVRTSDTRWWIAPLGAWAVASIVVLAIAIRQIRHFNKLLQRTDVADGEVLAMAQSIAHRLGMKKCPDVLLVRGVVVPMLWAIGRPKIVLSTSLFDQLGRQQQEHVLAHEIGHYARSDHWTGSFAFLVTAIFWWHPVAWCILRILNLPRSGNW